MFHLSVLSAFTNAAAISLAQSNVVNHWDCATVWLEEENKLLFQGGVTQCLHCQIKRRPDFSEQTARLAHAFA